MISFIKTIFHEFFYDFTKWNNIPLNENKLVISDSCCVSSLTTRPLHWDRVFRQALLYLATSQSTFLVITSQRKTHLLTSELPTLHQCTFDQDTLQRMCWTGRGFLVPERLTLTVTNPVSRGILPPVWLQVMTEGSSRQIKWCEMIENQLCFLLIALILIKVLNTEILFIS